jgi:hypothetical protein
LKGKSIIPLERISLDGEGGKENINAVLMLSTISERSFDTGQ